MLSASKMKLTLPLILAQIVLFLAAYKMPPRPIVISDIFSRSISDEEVIKSCPSKTGYKYIIHEPGDVLCHLAMYFDFDPDTDGCMYGCIMRMENVTVDNVFDVKGAVDRLVSIHGDRLNITLVSHHLDHCLKETELIEDKCNKGFWLTFCLYLGMRKMRFDGMSESCVTTYVPPSDRRKRNHHKFLGKLSDNSKKIVPK